MSFHVRELLAVASLVVLPQAYGETPAPYPLKRGTTWIYQSADGKQRTSAVLDLSLVRINNTSIPAAVFERMDGSKRLVFRSTEEWVECGPVEADTSKIHCENPTTFFTWPLSPGTRWQSSDLEFVVIAQEDIAVPLQTFKQAWRIAYSAKGSLDPLGEMWVAEGVGPVRISEQGTDYRLIKFDSGQGKELATCDLKTFLKRENIEPSFVEKPKLRQHLFRMVDDLPGSNKLLWLFALAFLVIVGFLGFGIFKVLGKPTEMTADNEVVDVTEEKRILVAMAKSGNLKEARERLEELVEKHPSFADLWFHLGIVAKNEKHWDKARTSLEQALRLNPKYTQARLELGKILFERGDTQECIRHLEQVVKEACHFPDAHMELGRAWLKLGDKDKARKALEKALELNPALAKIRPLMSQC